MEVAMILRMLPYIMQAVTLAQQISGKTNSGSVLETIKAHGSEVLELVTKAGQEMFPTVPPHQQAAAGAARFDPNYTMAIQQQLNQLGSTLEVDGSYGAKTKMAVAGFQHKNDLTVDGWAGPNTKRLLDAKAPIRT